MHFISFTNEKETTELLINNTLIVIDVNLLDRVGSIIKAVSHKLRNDMLQLIHKEGYINVTDIYLKMGLEQTTASQHLAILREAGLVNTKREGKCIFYTVNYERLKAIQLFASQLINE